MDRQLVYEYHDRTKHHYHRFARSLGYLDWATQPNPFRTYDGAPRVPLVHTEARTGLPFDDLFTPASSSSGPIDLRAVSFLLRFSMGLSAWKQSGPSRWSLRVNPSSGNLHPTECYVIASGLDRQATAVYHYLPEAHALELRYEDEDLGPRLGVAPSTSALIGLTTIHWREAWKYGERAFRYCQHDTGHAIAAVALAARMLGWDARLVPASSDDMAALLGLDRSADFGEAEAEEPQCLIRVGHPPLDVTPVEPASLHGAWYGRANRLSVERIDWPIIEEVASETRMTASPSSERHLPAPPAVRPPPRDAGAAAIILKRRSAVALDGASAIDRAAFVRMLERVMPAATPPWTALRWAPRVHLALFVHRVTGIDPGLYLLVRNAESDAFIRSELQRDFLWARVPGVTDALPLFCLARGDCRRLSERVSCHQEIASDGFFSLGMIAEFEPVIESEGASAYRRLFWECGVVGQVLYLEAEASGVRSTGIGCFFDEPVHDTLGIFSHRLQSLYHFTVGVAVEDTRLTTERGYEWENTSS